MAQVAHPHLPPQGRGAIASGDHDAAREALRQAQRS
jgi:hypothetical protein